MPQSLLKATKKTEGDSLELSVVIPMRNEEGNVLPIVNEVNAELAQLEHFEIICVDDGSDDNTENELRQAKASFPKLRIIQHMQPYGQSTATRTGIRAAYAPWVVTLDGDGQNPPSEILSLVNAREHALEKTPKIGPLMIAGQRETRKDGWFRRFCSIGANGLRNLVLRDGIRDTGCSLKLFRRDTFLDLPYFDHMHRFLPALVQRAGGHVITVNVKHRPRANGHTKYGLMNRLWTGIVDLLGVLWLMRRAKQPTINELD